MAESVAKTQSRSGKRSQNFGVAASSTMRPSNRPNLHNQ